MIAMMSIPAQAATLLDPASVTWVAPAHGEGKNLGQSGIQSAFTNPGASEARNQNFAAGRSGNGRAADRSITPPSISAVPEPGTWAMIVAGAGIIGFAMRRRSKVRTNTSFV